MVLDDRDNVKSGRKYNEWEIKGIPIRLEIGKEELEGKKLKLVRRCDGAKKDVNLDGIHETVKQELEEIKKTMYQNAHDKIHNKIVKAEDWKTFMTELNKK